MELLGIECGYLSALLFGLGDWWNGGEDLAGVALWEVLLRKAKGDFVINFPTFLVAQEWREWAMTELQPLERSHAVGQYEASYIE